ncbi:MAG TPA: hypothetical protein VKH44_12260 [Pirellulaceae bacterium]|nr:hypothetical protein [Pirellulaceae bacterium]
MRTNLLAIALLYVASGAVWAADDKPAVPEADPQLARQVGRAVGQLNDDRASERDAAEKKLLELAGKSTAEADHFLQALPKESDQMPVAVRERLAHIRKQVEYRAAKAATAATTVTLVAKDMALTDVIAAIEKQTGNRFIDNREQQGEPANAQGARINIELKGEPFWSAVDQIFDQAKLGIYSYGGKDAVAINSQFL